MITPHQKNLQLLQYAEAAGLYPKLILQLGKDFTRSNISFDVPENTKPEEFKSYLKEKIYVLLMEKFDDYLNLLYIIDVPEKAFSKVKSTDVVEVAEEVTYLILQREWQKVWLKHSYGTNMDTA